jgi:hypothetical protein
MRPGAVGLPGSGAPPAQNMVFAAAFGAGAAAGAGWDGAAAAEAEGAGATGADAAAIGLPQYGHLALGSLAPLQFWGKDSLQFGHFVGLIASSSRADTLRAAGRRRAAEQPPEAASLAGE